MQIDVAEMKERVSTGIRLIIHVHLGCIKVHHIFRSLGESRVAQLRRACRTMQPNYTVEN